MGLYNRSITFLVNTILFKIIARLKLLGDYSYSFQGSVEISSIAVTVSLPYFGECSYSKQFPSGIFENLLQLQLDDLMVFNFKM